MARSIVFLSVLVGFAIILTFSKYKNLSVNNEKFDFQKSAAAYHGTVAPEAAPEASKVEPTK